MSLPIGPYSITAGTPIGPIKLGRDVGAVQIHNDSPYNLYVALGEQAPTATDALSGAYTDVVTPWAHPVLYLQPRAGSPAEQATNAVASFRGTLYLMPVLPPGLVNAGGVSALAQVHVTVYSTWEQSPQAWANPRQQDVTSQPRVIAVPATPQAAYVGHKDFTGPGTQLLDALHIFCAAPTSGGAWDGNKVALIYLYASVFTIGNTATWLGGQLRAVALGSGSYPTNVLATYPLADFELHAYAAAGVNSSGMVFSWPNAPAPAMFKVTPPSGTLALSLDFNCNGMTGSATATLHWNILIDADSSQNTLPPPAPGGGIYGAAAIAGTWYQQFGGPGLW